MQPQSHRNLTTTETSLPPQPHYQRYITTNPILTTNSTPTSLTPLHHYHHYITTTTTSLPPLLHYQLHLTLHPYITATTTSLPPLTPHSHRYLVIITSSSLPTIFSLHPYHHYLPTTHIPTSLTLLHHHQIGNGFVPQLPHLPSIVIRVRDVRDLFTSNTLSHSYT